MKVFVINPLKLFGHVLGFALTAMLIVALWASAAAAQVSFKEDVFPIIELRCLECHQSGGDGFEARGTIDSHRPSYMIGIAT